MFPTMSIAVFLSEVSHPYLAAIFHFVLGFLSCFLTLGASVTLYMSAASLAANVFVRVCRKYSRDHPVGRSCGMFPRRFSMAMDENGRQSME